MANFIDSLWGNLCKINRKNFAIVTVTITFVLAILFLIFGFTNNTQSCTVMSTQKVETDIYRDDIYKTKINIYNIKYLPLVSDKCKTKEVNVTWTTYKFNEWYSNLHEQNITECYQPMFNDECDYKLIKSNNTRFVILGFVFLGFFMACSIINLLLVFVCQCLDMFDGG